MPKQKRKHDFGGSRSIPKRDMPLPESPSPKQRKQLAHNAPVRRAAGKFREWSLRTGMSGFNCLFSPISLRSGQKGRPRDERRPYESLATKYETNSPTKQRDLFQAT